MKSCLNLASFSLKAFARAQQIPQILKALGKKGSKMSIIFSGSVKVDSSQIVFPDKAWGVVFPAKACDMVKCLELEYGKNILKIAWIKKRKEAYVPI